MSIDDHMGHIKPPAIVVNPMKESTKKVCCQFVSMNLFDISGQANGCVAGTTGSCITARIAFTQASVIVQDESG